MYERLQRFVLKTFELTFIELLVIGFPVSIFSIIGPLAGIDIGPAPAILVCCIAAVWFSMLFMMWILKPYWTIPIGKMKFTLDPEERTFGWEK
jgi:hypothetical protein